MGRLSLNFNGSKNCKPPLFFSLHMYSIFFRCLCLVCTLFILWHLVLNPFPGYGPFRAKHFYWVNTSFTSNLKSGIRRDKFLEVPQIVWGLNNQKIAFARACLTARMLNRTLLMPSLSASLFYKEVELLEAIAFEQVFQFEKFNSLCNEFIRLGRHSELSNKSVPIEVRKGSGRRWTVARDLEQLKEFGRGSIDDSEVIRIVGKNPFLWHDHWPVKDYAKIFECLVLVDEIDVEAAKVISRIRGEGDNLRRATEIHRPKNGLANSSDEPAPYVAVHMRIEKDWMLHCKKLEQRSNITEICSSKEEIMDRVAHIAGLNKPVIVYLAVADNLLDDESVLSGRGEGLFPYEKKKLGIWDVYRKYPYLIKSAIDYEVCVRSDIFVGNSFSTFSSLVVLERTQKLRKMGTNSCVRWGSYAYNILGEDGGPHRWMADMSRPSLQAISYGTVNISC